MGIPSMLIITPNSKLKRLQEICEKFGVACSDIGKVTSDGLMHVKNGSKTVVKIRAKTVANAPLLIFHHRVQNIWTIYLMAQIS